jgi:hypothetical protein
MTKIEDISPRGSNTNISTDEQSVNGRMLALASSLDGQSVLSGSYSNLWASNDGGQTWDQITWPQPAPGQFDVPGALGGWTVMDIAVSPVFQGWRVDRHPRMLADVNGDGRADIVGFGDSGVWIALSNGDGTFQDPYLAVPDFGYIAGGWRVEKHLRTIASLSAKGSADIVGFGDAGVWVAFNNGNGTFQAPHLAVPNFGYNQGWRVDRHPRFLADLTGSGLADIIGFGDAGVWVARNDGHGHFQDPALDPSQPIIKDFGYVAGGWRVEKHPRMLADVNGDGREDIVGFGDAGVWVAVSNGDGTFQAPHLAVANFGYQAGDWRVEKHPRFLADLTGRDRADIVGFGDAGIWVGLNKGDVQGNFLDPAQDPNQPVIKDLGYVAGGWRVEKHPRMLARLTTRPWTDIVGFGNAGVWVALNKGAGAFQDPKFVLADFGYEAGGWRVEKHPRFLADLAGKGWADIVGFGDAGVWVALNNGDGTFQAPQFVLGAFGYNAGGTVLALTRNNREVNDRGIWRSTDGGNNWQQVHQFPLVPGLNKPFATPVGQLVWAPGNDRWVYAAGGSSLAISQDGGKTFKDVFPWGKGPDTFKRVNHVAVAAGVPSNPTPPVIYALGDNEIFVSFDSGNSWIEDQGMIPKNTGGAVSDVNGQAPRVMVVSPRSPLEVFLVNNGSVDPPPCLFRGDYDQFLGNHISTWEDMMIPNLDPHDQDSGNVFLATPLPGHGDLLFYAPHQSFVYVGPLDPQSPADWHKLPAEGSVHPDLHGLFLSPDFEGTFQDGQYQAITGTVWLLSDGGIYRSTDGGRHFQAAQNVRTLAAVNIAGAALKGVGPALSLNNGDNDGFYSLDGGKTWVSQDYGGGDNDCSFADPLAPGSMLVFTPRWDTNRNNVPASQGGTVTYYMNHPISTPPILLPDARKGTASVHTVPGPVHGVGHTGWNASSGFVIRGFRPIVLSKPGDSGPEGGDYVFIRFKTDHQATLLRTHSIMDIDSPDDWETLATTPYEGARVFQQGPRLPAEDVGVVQASGGHTGTVFYVGGDKNNQLWKWTDGMTGWQLIAPGKGISAARRFFVDPYRPNLLYALDVDHVKRSEDGGANWQIDENLEDLLSEGCRIPIVEDDMGGGLVLTDMQFDPFHSMTRFAVGEGGAFFTNDGVNWNRLLDTDALPGLPANCYYDWVSNPCERALYVSFAGRGLVKISPLPWGANQAPDPELWSANVKVDGQASKSTPAVAVFQGLMHMVRNDGDSNQLIWATSADGVNWDTVGPVPGQKSKAGASITVFDNKLHMVHLGDSSNNIWYSTNDGSGWTDNVQIPGQSSQTLPALVAFKGKLIMLHTGDGSNDIYQSELDGTTWSQNFVIGGQQSKSPVKLAVFQNKIHMVHLGDSSNQVWWSVSDDGKGWWPNARVQCQLSQSVPALAVHNGLLHMIHQGDDNNKIWWSVYDGEEWTPNVTIPAQLSQSGAALCETPDQGHLVMLHLGDSGDTIWFSEV